MTVIEIFKRNDFESVIPHLNHLFEVNSKHSMSAEFIEVCKGIYNYWTDECEPKSTGWYIRLASRWEWTSPFIDMNCSIQSKEGFRYTVAGQEDMIEVLGMEVKVDDDVEISEVELAAGLFWEMTYREPENIVNKASVSK